MSILIFCGPIDNDFFNYRTNLLNKLCDIYVTVHSVLSNVAKNHSRLPAGMIFQTLEQLSKRTNDNPEHAVV